MTDENTPQPESDDVEGHRKVLIDGPSESDDVEGHRKVLVDSTDDEDVEGHKRRSTRG